MKIMFISDIHGISSNLKLIEKKFKELKCNKLVVLGDIYYIGPRNSINDDYNIKEVYDFLNSFKSNIICIKGNCDSEIDEEINEFPIINKIGIISTDDIDIYLTHGHIYNEDNWNVDNSVLIYGHFHIPFIKKINNKIFINPGSISLPKNGNKPTYLIYEKNRFTIYDVSGKIVDNIAVLVENKGNN